MQRSNSSTALLPILEANHTPNPIESYNIANWHHHPENKSKSYLDVSAWITISFKNNHATKISVHNWETKKKISLIVETGYKIYQLLSGNRLGIIYSDKVNIINLHTGLLDRSTLIHKNPKFNMIACGLNKAIVSLNNQYLLIFSNEHSGDKRRYIAIMDIDSGESISIEIGKDIISDFTLIKSNQLLVASHSPLKFEYDLNVFDFNMATKEFTKSTVVIAPFLDVMTVEYCQILGGWDNPYITVKTRNSSADRIDFSLYQLERLNESYHLRKVKNIAERNSKEGYLNLWGIPIANSLVYLDYSSSVIKIMEFNFSTLTSQELRLPNIDFDFEGYIPEVFDDSQLVVKTLPRRGDTFQFIKLNLASVLSYIKEYRNEEDLRENLYQMQEIKQLPTVLIKIISDYTLSNNKIRFFPSCSIEEKTQEEFNNDSKVPFIKIS